MLDDNSILSYGTRNKTIDGFAPRNISKDFGKTWHIDRSPVPGQGGGRNPVMLKLKSGRLLYVSNFKEAKDPNVKGFEGPGGYVGLSEDCGSTWKIRKLVGGLTKDKDGKPVEVRTVGYVGASQSTNGIIHLVTSRNNPDLHFELNEAWILNDRDTAMIASAKDHFASDIIKTEKHKDFYPDGSIMVEYSSSVTKEGLYVLNGSETWYYKNGKKQWQTIYSKGRKIDTETYSYPDGMRKWQWIYNSDGTKDWTVWKKNGNIKAKSHWKEDKLLAYEIVK